MIHKKTTKFHIKIINKITKFNKFKMQKVCELCLRVCTWEILYKSGIKDSITNKFN